MRGLKTAAIAVVLTGLAMGPLTGVEAGQQTQSRTGRERGWRLEECRFASRDGVPGWNVEEVKSTVRCAHAKWAGNLDLGFAIIGCESSFRATAANSTSSAGGVWQALDSTWTTWKTTYADLMRWWNMRPGKLNGRTNAILGWRVFRGTTAPWEASRSCWG